jgi:hypothetical protein
MQHVWIAMNAIFRFVYLLLVILPEMTGARKM